MKVGDLVRHKKGFVGMIGVVVAPPQRPEYTTSFPTTSGWSIRVHWINGREHGVNQDTTAEFVNSLEVIDENR